MIRRFIGSLVTAVLLLGSAHAEPVNCQKQIVKNLLKFKKTYLKKVGKCVDNQNLGKLSGPCPDTATQLKLDTLAGKIRTKIELSCPDPDLATLGFPSSCAFETTATGIESTCKALPVTTPGEFADCLLCWKGAELASFLGVLYASHAIEICDGALDETSPTCSELDCATPLPSQHDLGDTGENDCQKAIGKAGIKYLLAREKLLEKCALEGGTKFGCLGDTELQLKLTKAVTKRDTVIQDKCGNRDPIPSPPFCCKTTGNNCMAAADRDSCELGGGQVQEGKTCNLSNNCDPVPGGVITWWDSCVNKYCNGSGVTTLDDVKNCVGLRADEIVDSLLCYQVPRNGHADWLCPTSPSAAFLD